MLGLHLFSIVFFAICLIAAIPMVQGGQCDLSKLGLQVTEVVCNNTDNSLDDDLRNAFARSSPDRRNEVETIYVEQRRGQSDLTINEQTFATFPNLAHLWLHGGYPFNLDRRLKIHPQAFRDSAALRTFRVISFNISDDGTLRAIESLQDQVGSLEFSPMYPAEKIVLLLVNFTRLWHLDIGSGIIPGGDRFVPSDVLAKSAPTLEQLGISGCPPPDSKISARLFANMPNLALLEWIFSNITVIEAGSFDANPKLDTLRLHDNRIRSLPDGLFSKLNKLESVDFGNNDGLSGLARSNFTHVEKYSGRFWLGL